MEISSNWIIYLVFWIFGFLFLFRIARPRSAKSRRGRYPSLSIVIPARNEEDNLPRLLASVREQPLKPLEVIVVDDSSADHTSEVALVGGARVIYAGELPQGWTGKTWACHRGALAAQGELILFLDADTVLEQEGLRRMLDTWLDGDGVISIQPYHSVRRLYEELSAFFNIVMMGAMQCFTVLGHRLKPIGLFGPAIMLSKKQYAEAGGFENVRHDIVEDMALAAAFQKNGIRLRCYGGRGTINFRMYPGGICNLIQGWSKGLALGASRTSIPLLIMIVAWVTGSIGAVIHLVQSAWIADPNLWLSWLLLFLAYVLQIYWMLYRIGSFKLYTALLYPLAAVFFVLVFLYSFITIFFRRSVTWKGRQVRITGRR
jgi:4,4'-diaponeurosporenoate glycosyltransferase